MNVIALLLVLSVQSSGRPEIPEVTTTGSAQRSVRPDLAIIGMDLSAEGATPAEAGSRVAARIDSLRRALATLGIPPDSVVNRARWNTWDNRIQVVAKPTRWVPRTTIGPQGQTRQPVTDTIYRANDQLEVRIRDLSRVGAVIDTLLGRGITKVTGVQFSVVDASAAHEEALREATVRARREAEAIAEAGGMRLGAVISLSTQGPARSTYRITAAMSGGNPEGNSPTIVVAPAIPVSVTVTGRWALVAKR